MQRGRHNDNFVYHHIILYTAEPMRICYLSFCVYLVGHVELTGRLRRCRSRFGRTDGDDDIACVGGTYLDVYALCTWRRRTLFTLHVRPRGPAEPWRGKGAKEPWLFDESAFLVYVPTVCSVRCTYWFLGVFSLPFSLLGARSHHSIPRNALHHPRMQYPTLRTLP